MSKPVRFVLVDDDPLSLALTEKALRNCIRRPVVIQFSTAEAALAFISSDVIPSKEIHTVLITDLHMPELDGFALMREIVDKYRHLTENLHVFVLSGEATPDEVRTVFFYRCVIGFYSKPITQDNIKEILTCIEYRL